MKILRDAAAGEPAAGGPVADPVVDPTAADTAAKGKTAREIALEKRISIIEDNNNTLQGQLKEFLKTSEARDKAPAKKITPEALLDETNQFLGWGLA